ncbi:MAG: hypothetical protein LIO67_10995 [Lachnospiraceae bacterium]|nr:hypothetical protein [Lachnospiraceae bacterium]
MASYNLESEEAIILQSSCVMHGGLMSAYTDEIILTNMNFIYVSKGIFGNVKNIMKYPLESIKVYQGIAQALVAKAQNGDEALQINFEQGTEIYCFQNDPEEETEKWVNGINRIITGSPSPYIQPEDDEWFFAGAIRDTVGVFKDALGFKKEKKNDNSKVLTPVEPCKPIGLKREQKKDNFEEAVASTNKVSSESENVTKKCIGCMAPLSGKKGDYIICKYCDTEQTL